MLHPLRTISWCAALSGLAPAICFAVPETVQAPAASTLYKLHGPAFCNAVDQALSYEKIQKWAPAEWTRLAVQYAAEHREVGEERVNSLDRVFSSACLVAGDAEVDALAQIYLKSGIAGSPTPNAQLMSLLTLAWCRRELRALALEKRTTPPASVARAEPPAILAGAPPELIDAWQAYSQAVVPGRRGFLAADGRWRAIERENAQAEFDGIVANILLRRPPRGETLSTAVSRFVWHEPCGTGSEILYVPQTRARLMAFLHERRFNEAIAAALTLCYDPFSDNGGDEINDVDVEVLAGLGAPWEKLFIGSYLDRLNDAVAHFWTVVDSELLLKVASKGAADQAGLLVSLAQFMKAHPGHETDLIDPIATLLAPSPTLSVEGYTSARQRHRAAETGTLPDAVQREALKELQRLTSRPTETRAGSVPSDPEAPPTRFRFLLNGKPMKGQEVSWEAIIDKLNSDGGAGDTNDDGVLELPSKLFSEPTPRVQQIVFRSRQPSDQRKFPAEALRFRVTVPAPDKQDQVVEVPIQTASLTVRLARPNGVRFDAEARVLLNRKNDPEAAGDAGSEMESIGSYSLPPDGIITFPLLRPGQYFVEAGAPGCADWKSSLITLGEMPLELAATLDRGVDVTGRFVGPRRTPTVSIAFGALSRDGVELPPNYLRIRTDFEHLYGLGPADTA